MSDVVDLGVKNVKFVWSEAQKVLKAVVAFLVPTLTLIIADLNNGVTAKEFVRHIAVGVLTSMVVWASPNKENG